VQLLEVLVRAEIVFCAAAAGVRVLSASALASANSLIIAGDVNAVPPAGIEGLQLMDNGVELPGGILGIGPLAIGDVKYKTEAGLFQRLAASSTHLALDFRDAFAFAREIA
jgi:methylene-tetrahydromethanopterin dehydrogenase